MNTPTQTALDSSQTVHPWLVIKGAVLNDDFPGKDFDAVRLDDCDAEMEASIANAMGREEDLEAVLYWEERHAETLGRAPSPTRASMGLRVFIAYAPDLESLCLNASPVPFPELFFETAWPAESGRARRLVLSGMPAVLTKQLRMLLEEGCHIQLP
jgi:hypothetical protein